jgi:hypothetical protein
MVPKEAATPSRGREPVLGNGTAGRGPTSRSEYRRSLYGTEARSSQRDIVWAKGRGQSSRKQDWSWQSKGRVLVVIGR